VKLALAETSGPLRRVVEPLLLELITPDSCCHEGIAILSGVIPPPESTHAVSEDQGPPALAVTRSVPPTETTYASSAGHASFLVDQVELSPEAAKKFGPWVAFSGN
jgi:hypothetical protein